MGTLRLQRRLRRLDGWMERAEEEMGLPECRQGLPASCWRLRLSGVSSLSIRSTAWALAHCAFFRRLLAVLEMQVFCDGSCTGAHARHLPVHSQHSHRCPTYSSKR